MAMERGDMRVMETEGTAGILSGTLPNELVVQILKRVPTRHLMSKFKLVRKSWRSLIQSPVFVVEQMEARASLSTNKYGGAIFLARLIIDYGNTDKNGKKIKDSPLCYFYGINSPQKFQNMSTPIPFKVGTSDKTVRIVATGDGILYIRTRYAGDCLWNPVSGEFECKYVPDFHPEVPNGGILLRIFFGLCFDAAANNVKVVRVWNVKHQALEEGNVVQQTSSYAAVWNSGTPNWRQIDAVVPAVIGPNIYENLYLRGRCYWRASTNDPESIVSFHMVNEEFKNIPLPDPIIQEAKEYGCSPIWTMAQLKQSVAIIALPQSDDDALHVWQLNDESWSLYLTVQRPKMFKGIVPLGFCQKDEVVFSNSRGFLFFYNVRTRKCTRTGVKMDMSRDQPFFLYNESLVCVKERGTSKKRKIS